MIKKKKMVCKNFGIYAAQCNESKQYYVGQAITSEIKDQAALKLQYTKKHPTSNKVFKKAFSITLNL